MDEPKYYVRFVNARNGRPIFGKSKHRPSEGWIDAHSWSPGTKGKSGGDYQNASVMIDSNDSTCVLLYQACSEAMDFEYILVELHRGVKWFRYVMSKSWITGFQYSVMSGRDGPVAMIYFDAQKVQLIKGG